MPSGAQKLPDSGSLTSDKGVNLEVCQCSKCGLVQLNNEPVSYYREVIRAAAYSEEMRRYRQNQFNNFLDMHSLLGKNTIEIGCGRGEYLSILSEAGAEAYGIEYSQDAVQACNEKGLRVTQGFVDNFDQKITNGPFNAFFIMSFLEHLPNPNSTLQGIHNNLTKDAVGLIEVPNFDMILTNNLFSELIIDHLFYFTKETLTSTLSYNGFEVIDCKSTWNNYILSATVRKRTPTNLSMFRSYQKQIGKDLSRYIARFQQNRVAVWGAGHQSLTVLAMSDLNGKIQYVIDSAPFKQGKFTPVTHIPIVSPKRLKEDPVDAVIVMAAAYSNEVADILRTDHPDIQNVVILENSKLKEVK